MSRRMVRAVPTGVALLAAAALYLATPPAPRASAANCGGGNGPVCRVVEIQDCIKIFCYKLIGYWYYDVKFPLREVG